MANSVKGASLVLWRVGQVAVFRPPGGFWGPEAPPPHPIPPRTPHPRACVWLDGSAHLVDSFSSQRVSSVCLSGNIRAKRRKRSGIRPGAHISQKCAIFLKHITSYVNFYRSNIYFKQCKMYLVFSIFSYKGFFVT